MELSELIESVDILEYISQYTEFTEKNGEYWALSPLKDENTPSFSVRKETNTFYDFSSGVGGNVLTFIRYYDRLGYSEAIAKLKEYAGFNGSVQPHRKISAVEVAKRFAPPKKMHKTNKSTVLSDDYMERYEKREDKLAVWKREGISEASLDRFQVYYDSFSDRLVYPIRNTDGKIINVGGRTLDEHWKEKKMRKYTYFMQWGELNTIYGLAENIDYIREKREIILFEGAKSVMLADTWGVRNTGAILTSHLNPNQMKILAKLGCRVVFAFDKDVAVRNDYNIKRLKQFVKVEYVWDKDNLLSDKDAPVDKGFETWERLYEGEVIMALDKQYTLYHLHSDLSNGVTNIDSVTKYGEYIAMAKECGMKALAFSEHGSVFEWWHKKCEIEAAGMKYIHAVEAYLTADLNEKVRDNYHCVLIARNYDGFLELNSLISSSFNRKDNHFYYAPRISFEELFHTSDNIIITTACVGGVFGKGDDDTQNRFLDFLMKNKHRCFLEIGHHSDERQLEYNRKLFVLSEQTDIPLIAGTDTHVLNVEHERGRGILQASKNIQFDGEENWDLRFKTYDELVCAYQRQQSLPESIYMEAIENTNRMADMVEEYTLDRGTKYPHIYENPEETFRNKVKEAVKNHPYANKNHTKEELNAVIDEEFEVYKATKSIDFMLLQTYLREWERENGIQCGYGRGSVSGSMIAYLLGVTQMDSLRFGLNFFRFMNPSRVTNADIDTDYSGKDRETVKQFLLRDKMNLSSIRSAEIITFNTIALKGAIRDVCRALYKDKADVNYIQTANHICKEVEIHEESVRKKYPEVFKYVDIVNGTVVSIGTHPSGVLISDLPIDQTVGLCSISTSDYPVSMINMKELDDLMYVKLDILGLDNIGVINETCKILGIEQMTPDNTDMEDMDVWKSIRDNTTLIFQWESNSAQQYMKKFMSDETLEIAKSKIPNFSMLKWMSFGNGLLRPACASFRDSVACGEFYDNGFDALNEFLSPEAGRIAMQETIMQFLVKFCGYSQAESDNVRRAIAKKKGTETLLPEIERRFIEYTAAHYDISEERCGEVIKPFLQIILDASAYGFSWNHSDAYSSIGYICGYLRYHYPLEFLTSALNIFGDNMDKTADITSYATRVGIKVTLPKWGLSRGQYFFDREKKIIAKGLSSIKYMSSGLADELYNLANSKEYDSFMDVLKDLDEKTSINSRQLEILIKLDFFSDFGNQRELLRLVDLFANTFKKGQAKQIKKSVVDGTPLEDIVKRYAVGVTKSGGIAKSYTLLDVMSILKESEALIKSMGMDDLSDIIKVRNFYDVMGYIGYVSGKDSDRRKLYVTEVKPLHRKSDGKQFGYSIFTKSIGSGKESRFTVFNRVYDKDPIKDGDIIYCKGYERDGQYFHLTAYEKVF